METRSRRFWNRLWTLSIFPGRVTFLFVDFPNKCVQVPQIVCHIRPEDIAANLELHMVDYLVFKIYLLENFGLQFRWYHHTFGEKNTIVEFRQSESTLIERLKLSMVAYCWPVCMIEVDYFFIVIDHRQWLLKWLAVIWLKIPHNNDFRVDWYNDDHGIFRLFVMIMHESWKSICLAGFISWSVSNGEVIVRKHCGAAL